MRWFCPSSMFYKLLVACCGTPVEIDEHLEVQEYGNQYQIPPTVYMFWCDPFSM